MGRKSTQEGVSPLGDRIQVRLRWRGQTIRPTLDLMPTSANLKHAYRLREKILQEIKDGACNLLEYFPEYKFAHKIEVQSDTRGRTLNEWASLWEDLMGRELEDSSLRIYKRHLKAYWLKPFGDLTLIQFSHEKVLRHLAKLSAEHENGGGKVVQGLSRKTQNNLMIPLRGVCQLACRLDKSLSDPTDGIDNLKTQDPEPDPFTADEVDAVLKAIKQEPEYADEVSDYFEFAMFAGLRVSEQIALRWVKCDLRLGIVRVDESRVLSKTKNRTKTSVARDVELNARALAVLERQRSRTQLHSEHVFLNPWTKKPWHDEQTQRRTWERILRRAKVRYRPPKECRDTSVTLALVAGCDPLWVARQHGHSLQVMLRDYARWIPKADRGRNLETMNRALSISGNAVEAQYAVGAKEKSPG